MRWIRMDGARIAACVVGTMVAAGPVSAQLPEIGEPLPIRVGAGYVANAPHLLLGGAVWGSVPVLGRLGLYVDAKFDAAPITEEVDFVDGLTAQEVDDELGDIFVRGEDNWRSVNAALMRPLTRQLTVYAGAGMTEQTHYRHYYDGDRELGRLGYYWVEDPEGSGQQLNLMAGALFGLNDYLVFQFGGETMPWGFTVGLSVAFPGLDL